MKKNEITKINSNKLLKLHNTMTEDNLPLRPLVKWSGGKADEIKLFEKYIPKYKTYIEPFVGGGAVYFHLNPKKAIINDIHPELIAFYREILTFVIPLSVALYNKRGFCPFYLIIIL